MLSDLHGLNFATGLDSRVVFRIFSAMAQQRCEKPREIGKWCIWMKAPPIFRHENADFCPDNVTTRWKENERDVVIASRGARVRSST